MWFHILGQTPNVARTHIFLHVMVSPGLERRQVSYDVRSREQHATEPHHVSEEALSVQTVLEITTVCLPLLTSCHEGEPLKKMNILLVFQKRAMQFGQSIRTIPLEVFCRQILGQNELEPVKHFRC